MQIRTISDSIEALKEVGFNFGESTLNTKVPYTKEQTKFLMKKFIADLQWLPAYDKVVEWLEDNKGKGLLLIGPCGLGKTVFATRVIPVLLHWAMDRVATVVSAYDLNKKETELEDRRLIVIDDIGVEDIKNDFGEKKSVFADIVDRAERRGDVLILTTNLTPEGLRKKYGERILDRLKVITKWVVFRGKSFRKQDS